MSEVAWVVTWGAHTLNKGVQWWALPSCFSAECGPSCYIFKKFRYSDFLKKISRYGDLWALFGPTELHFAISELGGGVPKESENGQESEAELKSMNALADKLH